MRRWLVVVLSLVATATGACTSGGQPTVVTTPNPDCAFASRLPARSAGKHSSSMSKDDVDEIVASAPKEIRGDLETFLETTRDIDRKSREIAKRPKSERDGSSGELLKLMSGRGFLAATQALDDYLNEHCPEFAPEPAASPDET